MRVPTTALLLAGALFLPLGCKSKAPAEPAFDAYSVECICGTPEEAMHGCPHPLCLQGKGNPANPECVCGPIDFGGSEEE